MFIMEIGTSKINNEKGLFATQKYFKGQIVHILSGEISNEPTRETIHIGNNVHIYDKYGIYINHSFTPNIYVNGRILTALCEIMPGEEIVFNYNDSEINMASPFVVDNVLVSGRKTI
jgi:hypothetical protein